MVSGGSGLVGAGIHKRGEGLWRQQELVKMKANSLCLTDDSIYDDRGIRV